MSAMLVFMMQAGFLCLESGLVRSKNSINVAAKNISDFVISSTVFWMFGFAIMFGDSVSGVFGSSSFFFGEGASEHLIAIFIFQMMFCGTAVTLVSGAVAERMSYIGYLLVALTISLLIYPVVGHWVWAGIVNDGPTGWLEKMGFVDFAGSTVVHSVGGWVALAAILIIGPRLGRYDVAGRRIPGSNLPLAILGGLLIWFGWFGFNGGSTLAWDGRVPSILLNTCLSAFWGGIVATFLKFNKEGYIDVVHVMNGVLAGLVAITANCHVVTPPIAAVIGGVAGVIVFYGERFLNAKQLDDAIGVIPVHLFAGIWGTMAVGLFADASLLGTGLSMYQQLEVQLLGVVVIGVYSFFVAYIVFRFLNYLYPLRISERGELVGLNVAEHNVSTEVHDLLSAMNTQQSQADFSIRVPVEPFTEVGQIAEQYNRVIDKVNDEMQERDDAFSAFKQSEFRKGAILDAAMDCIISIDGRGDIHEFNPAAELCFGVSYKAVNKRSFFNLFVAVEDRKLTLESLSQGFTLSEGLLLKRQNMTELQRYDGKKFPAEVVVTKTSGDQYRRKEYTLHVRDITQQVKLQNRLTLLAYNDPLTGLYNRTYFMESLKKRLRYQSEKKSGLVVLMFLDLDQFKKINDTLGHKVGDELLREVAKRLNLVTRESDLVGRWGGDEFAVVLSGDLSTDYVIKKAQSILQVMRSPVELSNNKLTVKASIGIAVSDNAKIKADSLFLQADMAMYDAKKKGRDTYTLFTDALGLAAQHRLQVEKDLPSAMSDNQFVLHYQPKVSCITNEVIGFEALLRWEHPEYGLIPPNDFIPIIEESHLIIDVGEWVLAEAVRQLAQWRQQGKKLRPIAVNISGFHLHDDSLLIFLKKLIHQYNISIDLIEVEITEGVLTGHTEESIRAMGELKSHDVKLSIDDFGTGYSSLSYLKKFPIDALKIDRSFVNECNSNKDDAAICIAIISLAKSLGLQTIAEGVETKEQLAFLKQQDCDIYQGFYFSKPLAADYVSALLN